ncbi:60S ribosomal protein L27a [Myotis davidii]|uniref:Large ribosomal subunit protein uL15 n=1 Tax=Myotis davidii TaxID=225400 RepID=L5M714_MYODS|nr:60S ribosomal protein L27a [Myotis davidii]
MTASFSQRCSEEALLGRRPVKPVTYLQGPGNGAFEEAADAEEELMNIGSATDMPSRLRKTQKLRGHMSHGHGCIGKHREHPGGRGYFGKVGTRHYHLNRNQSFCPTVNLDKLWTLVSEQTRGNAAKSKTGAAPITEVVRSDYYRVLGKGRLPKQPVIVKAKFFSRRAEEKITGVGGACVLVA